MFLTRWKNIQSTHFGTRSGTRSWVAGNFHFVFRHTLQEVERDHFDPNSSTKYHVFFAWCLSTSCSAGLQVSAIFYQSKKHGLFPEYFQNRNTTWHPATCSKAHVTLLSKITPSTWSRWWRTSFFNLPESLLGVMKTKISAQKLGMVILTTCSVLFY